MNVEERIRRLERAIAQLAEQCGGYALDGTPLGQILSGLKEERNESKESDRPTEDGSS
jgi:hypothetical protein